MTAHDVEDAERRKVEHAGRVDARDSGNRTGHDQAGEQQIILDARVLDRIDLHGLGR